MGVCSPYETDPLADIMAFHSQAQLILLQILRSIIYYCGVVTIQAAANALGYIHLFPYHVGLIPLFLPISIHRDLKQLSRQLRYLASQPSQTRLDTLHHLR
jgi:hypothetical protein